jgi:pantetheine-phosphate adenylyltransferase
MSSPPPGPPWDLPLEQAPLVFLDLEMTGLHPRLDRICEFGAIRTEGRLEQQRIATLIRPDVRSGHNSEIHGITKEMLESAPGFEEVVLPILDLLEGAIIVGHALRYDLLFLKHAFERLGRTFVVPHSLDTLPLARRCFGLPNHRLGTLAEHLRLDPQQAHRAEADAQTTYGLFFHVVDLLQATTPRDLLHVKIGQRVARPEILALVEEAIKAQLPVKIRYRSAGRAADELTMVLRELRADLDPPRVFGYLEPGRGRRELRADRILAISPISSMGKSHPGDPVLLSTPFHRSLVNVKPFLKNLVFALAVSLAHPMFVACSEPVTAKSEDGLSPAGKQWLQRATASFRAGDMDDAKDSIKSALAASPKAPSVRIAAAQINLARLEFEEVIRLLAGLNTSEARGLRGRAYWYNGEIEKAADELDALLSDPNVKDNWAKAISKLARSGGDRKPFQFSGGLLAHVPLGRARNTHFLMMLEIDGVESLAMIATGRGEVVLDRTTRAEPSWVQLRFGGRVEVSNVPALVEDLSGISKELGTPIKALIGINVLRRMRATFDLLGGQFIVRTFEPPPPPRATRVPISYALGGAMITRVGLKAENPILTPVLINTEIARPITLTEEGWKRAGIDVSSLQPLPGQPDRNLKSATLPLVRLGAFDMPNVPGIYGPPIDGARKATNVDLEGVIGSGLLATFRCTLVDEGRAMWIEDLPEEVQQLMVRENRERKLEPVTRPPPPPPSSTIKAPNLAPPPPPAPKGGSRRQPKTPSMLPTSISPFSKPPRLRPDLMTKKAIYAGSFDPLTLGHWDLIQRASSLFDTLVVAVGIHRTRVPLFSTEERVGLLREVVSGLPNVELCSFQGLLVDFCHQQNVQVIVRGLRASMDFEAELQYAHANSDMAPDLETIFLPTRASYGYISASLVREIASHGGDTSHFAPPAVCAALRTKFPDKYPNSLG